MKNKIKLPNRYRAKNYLQRIKGDVFKLVFEDENTTYQLTGSKDNIKAIDPMGGPYIYVGYEPYENMVVRKIEYNKEYGLIFIIN